MRSRCALPSPARRLAATTRRWPRSGRRGGEGGLLAFAPVSVYTLIDSPVLAGENFRDLELGPRRRPSGSASPPTAPPRSAVPPARLAAYRRLPGEALALFGAPPLPRLPLPLALSDRSTTSASSTTSRATTAERAHVHRRAAAARGDAAAARVRPLLERQVPPPRGARHARLQQPHEGRAALGLRGADQLPRRRPADRAQRHPDAREDPRVPRLDRRQPGSRTGPAGAGARWSTPRSRRRSSPTRPDAWTPAARGPTTTTRRC